MKHVVTTLMNHHIGVEKSQIPDENATADARKLVADSPLVMQDFWTIVLTDRDTGDQIRVGLIRKGRDGLINDLTGGIVLAGGQLPKI